MTINEAKAKVKQTFPAQLRDCMELCELRPTKLARAVGTTDSRVHEWLEGKNLASAPMLVALADVLGVSVDLLLTGEENENN